MSADPTAFPSLFLNIPNASQESDTQVYNQTFVRRKNLGSSHWETYEFECRLLINIIRQVRELGRTRFCVSNIHLIEQRLVRTPDGTLALTVGAVEELFPKRPKKAPAAASIADSIRYRPTARLPERGRQNNPDRQITRVEAAAQELAVIKNYRVVSSMSHSGQRRRRGCFSRSTTYVPRAHR